MFEQIVIVDKTGLQSEALNKLKSFSQNPIIIFNTNPKTENEVIERIKNADCLFVSWKTELTASILSNAKNLKYIGMCCSLYDHDSANVDINYASKRGITVTGIRDYGDEGLVEYIICEIIRLLKGLDTKQWKKEPVELKNRKVGIIGMGTTGKLLARRLNVFGAQVYYYNRSRKPEIEKEGINYLALNELLGFVEMVSIHLPKNTIIFRNNEFDFLGNGKILINTSLGLPFDVKAFKKWISNKNNYAIFDGDGVGKHKQEFDEFDNIISTEIVSGWTMEAKERLSNKVLENLQSYMQKQL